MNIKLLPLLAGISGMGASVEAGLPYNATNPSTVDALGRWPLTVILGAVCVVCVYFMYRQSRDNADKVMTTSKMNGESILSLIEGERLETQHRINSNALVTKELAENNAKVVKELAENNAKVVKELAENHANEIRTLLAELEKRGTKQS
jgi:hypothetical protein